MHIHHLLNEFRPHQARETLRVMMELQMRQRLETSTRFYRHLEKVRELVKNTFAALPDPDQLETDSKLTTPEHLMDYQEEKDKDEAGEDGIYSLDRIMCGIIDEMM